MIKHLERLWASDETRQEFKWPWKINRINSVAESAKCRTEKKKKRGGEGGGKEGEGKNSNKYKPNKLFCVQKLLQWKRNYCGMTIKHVLKCVVKWSNTRNAGRRMLEMPQHHTLRQSFCSTQNWLQLKQQNLRYTDKSENPEDSHYKKSMKHELAFLMIAYSKISKD